MCFLYIALHVLFLLFSLNMLMGLCDYVFPVCMDPVSLDPDLSVPCGPSPVVRLGPTCNFRTG